MQPSDLLFFSSPSAPVFVPTLAPFITGAQMSGADVALASHTPAPGLELAGYRFPDFTTPAYELVDTLSRTFQDQFNDIGTAQFNIPNSSTDRNLIDPDDIIRFNLDGRTVFTAVVTQDTSNTIDPNLEDGEQTEFDCIGQLGLLADAVVMPARGPDNIPIETDRLFSWPAPDFDDSGWTAAQSFMTLAAANSGGWPIQIGNGGSDPFPEPNAQLIGPPGTTPTLAPGGDWYVRKTITVPDQTRNYDFYIVADNEFDFFIDGQAFGKNDDLTGITVISQQLSAGDHTLAVHVNNTTLPLDAPPGFQNPTALVVAIFEADAGNIPLRTTADFITDDTWVGVYYPPKPPGMTVGQVITICFDEAQASGLLDGWELTFDEFVDSNGNPWNATGDISTKTGNDYKTFFINELVPTYIDLRAQPGGLVLDVFNKGELGSDRSAITLHGPTDPTDPFSTNLISLQHKRLAITATRFLVSWPGGWHIVDDTPDGQEPKIAKLTLGTAQSISEVETIALKQLQDFRQVRPAITVGWEPIDETDAPYSPVLVGDIVTVPDRDLAGNPEQVLSITYSEDTQGVISWAAELAFVIPTQEQRWDTTQKKLSDGSLQGNSRVATPLSDQNGLASAPCCSPVPRGG